MSANHHLLRRGGVYYYRRRVPLDLVPAIGSKFIQCSLGTKSATEAKKLRTAKDLEWDARFADCAKKIGAADNSPVAKVIPLPSDTEVALLVRTYVDEMDQRLRKSLAADPPMSELQKRDMGVDAELSAQILRDRDDPRAEQMVYTTGKDILKSAGYPLDPTTVGAGFLELVRRALLELSARDVSRLQDDHRHAFFDQLFNPARPPHATFGELAQQCLQLAKEEAESNRISQKWVDKQIANIALIREIVGDDTPIHTVDYDTCLRVRSILARMPANRSKLYRDLSLEQAIERAAIDGRPLLSPTTQAVYLSTLRDVLNLAAKKRLIPVNPADGMRPLKRDTVPDAEKRLPFTVDEIRTFFGNDFYRECAKHPIPYAHAKPAWRFWLPLVCVFLGARPNEVAQMLTSDLKRTAQGTWYLDIVTTADDDDGGRPVLAKTLKTMASRRKIPLHPELIAIGFVHFVEAQKNKHGTATRLFPDLKPDRYNNFATYPLKRFRDAYLPKTIKMRPRTSFYSFRHSWRDALRRIDAPAVTLQSLGAWSQGRSVSDDYGDKSDPDFQVKFIRQISFAGLNLSPLHLHVNIAKAG